MSQTATSLPLAGRLYLFVVMLAGTVAVTASFHELLSSGVDERWAILALLTLLSGSATVRLPSVQATISVSETFVFTSVLLFGPAAGTVTVALDALVMSFWLARRKPELQRLLFNMAAAPLSVWIAAKIFFAVAGVPPIAQQVALEPNETIDIARLVGPLLLFTVIYFLLNSWFIALAIQFEQRISATRVWRENLLWLSLNYFGGASVAILLAASTRNLNITLLVIVPLLLVLYFTFKTALGRVEDANKHLERVNELYLATIETLAMAIDAKDQITHGHLRRVQIYAVELAKAVGIRDSSLIKAVEAAALLHDMGKLAVPEYILNKPGPLTPAEFEKIKVHASVGADILSSIDFPYPVVPIVRHHHESWDGTGYPAGLSGADIPLGARVLAVVDCFDALTSDRPYRPRLSDSEATKILLERRGTMYDPLVVDAFVKLQPNIDVAPTAAADKRNALEAITEASGTPVGADPSRFEEISSSSEEMLALYDLARGLSEQLDQADAVEVISKHLRRIVPASWCVFYLYDLQSDELIASHAFGENAGLVLGLRIPLGERSSGWVAANRQTILNSDPVLDLGEIARSMQPRLRSCLGTPLVADERLIGVLALYSGARDAFTEDHRRVLEVVSRQVSKTIAKAVAFSRQRVNSLRDSLSKLPNLEALRQFVNSEIVERRDPVPLSLILIEIQGLKHADEVKGIPSSEMLISRLLDSARRNVRGADLLFRFGSNEFIALLPQTDTITARSLAKKIAASLNNHQLDTAPDLRFSAIIGIASGPADGTSLDTLIRVARSRLESPGGFAQRRDSVH
jgi:diguanylate cyclase (GGDEF)-like protein/putative nucleotidyltransferase with HDIG domain